MDSVAQRHRSADSRRARDGFENGNGSAPPDELEANALSVFLALARHRRAATGSRRDAMRPSRRHEDLCLSVSLGRLQRRCLACGLAPGSEFTPLLGGVDQVLVAEELQLRRIRRWVSRRGQRDSEARARQRLEAIAAEVRGELGLDRLVPPTPFGQQSPPTAEAAPVGKEPAPAPPPEHQERRTAIPAIKVAAYPGRAKMRRERISLRAALHHGGQGRLQAFDRWVGSRRRAIALPRPARLKSPDTSTVRAVALAAGLAAVLAWISAPLGGEDPSRGSSSDAIASGMLPGGPVTHAAGDGSRDDRQGEDRANGASRDGGRGAESAVSSADDPAALSAVTPPPAGADPVSGSDSESPPASPELRGPGLDPAARRIRRRVG